MLKRNQLILIVGMTVAAFGGCSKTADTPHDVNLLANPSFEVLDGELPEGWQIENFRGMPEMESARYGVDLTDASDGENSFYFEADSATSRFFWLSQEVEVQNISRLRVKALIKSTGLERNRGQYFQSNVAISLYDKDRIRFRASRFYDFRTQATEGTTDGWEQVERIFRVPRETRYVVFHCILGMEGKLMFDDLSLENPSELPWKINEGRYFTHHWVGDTFPEGSLEFQDELYVGYAQMLGVLAEDHERVFYYWYPDSVTMYETLGREASKYVDYDLREIHSIFPVDNHEIVHLLTHVYGQLPVSLAEGTAYYAMGDYRGVAIQPAAQKLLRDGTLPQLAELMGIGAINRVEPDLIFPASASFIGFLLEFGRPEQFRELHRRCKPDMTYQDFSDAFDKAYGAPLAESESIWRGMLDNADFSNLTEPSEPPEQSQ